MQKKATFLLIIMALITIALVIPTVAQDTDEPPDCPLFEDSPTEVRVSYYMGEGSAYFSSGQLVRSLESYTCVIEVVDDSYVPAYMQRAAVHSQRRSYELAIDDYTSAIELDSSLIPAFNNRAIMWMALTEYEDALDDFNQVLTLDANYVPGYNNRGVLYIVEGELDLALADFDQAISVSGIDGILEELTDPERPSNAERPEYDTDHAQAYALIGVVRSQQALDNYEAYLLLAGGARDRRVEAAAGALESRLSFELRVDDGTWLLVAGFGLE